MKTGRMMTLGVALLVAAGQMVTLSGCGKEEPPPPPPPKRDPPPPPPPVRIEISPLMIGVDARVQFPADKAPYDRNLAEAVISFATALATGDDATLGGMLGLRSREILDSMLADGSWFDETDEIEAVRVVYLGQEPDGADDANFAEFVLAVQQPGKAYTLGWSADDTDGGWVMSPMETPEGTRPRAADWDADSMADLALGQGHSQSAGSTPAIVSSALGVGYGEDIFDKEPIGAYLASELVKRFAPSKDPTFTQLWIFIEYGVPEDRVDELVRSGQKAVGGKLPSSSIITIVIDGVMSGRDSAISALGVQPWSRDDVIAAIAEILNKPVDEIRTLDEG